MVDQMGTIMALQANPRPDSSAACLLASISYVCAHTSPNKHTPEDFNPYRERTQSCLLVLLVGEDGK